MKNLFSLLSTHFAVLLVVFCMLSTSMSFAFDAADPMHAQKSSSEFVKLAWEYSGKQLHEDLEALIKYMLSTYGDEADQLHSQLDNFPSRDHIELYQSMNDLATALFVRAESYMKRGKKDAAIRLFESLQTRFAFSQAWDPSRGSYWSIAEKSQASIDVMNGKQAEEEIKKKPNTIPVLHTVGLERVVDYTKYGTFADVGTEQYSYTVTDQPGLSKAVGEGVYPNTGSVFKNPRYREVLKSGRLEGTHWDFVNTSDLEAAYFKWATAPEPWGVRLFYLGHVFQRAKMYDQAIKAYHALIVHFPDTVAWTYWQTPWYPAQAAVSKVKHIIREHPELNLHFKWSNIRIQNSLDNDPTNDRITTYPGVIEEINVWDKAKLKLTETIQKEKLEGIKRTLGNGRVQLVQYQNDHWQMLVDGNPYMVKGVMYAPTKVGQSPDKETLANWMNEDTNNNGLPDGPYDSWVDANSNNIQDENEPVVGDFQLMKDMGVNTIRLYHHPDQPNKEVLRKMYKDFGIMVIMGDFLGKYTLGSGANWFDGTDYENVEHKKAMMESVKKMVMEHKDEPYLLMWALGNENNYGVASNGDTKPEAYFAFANEVALMIKEMDSNHPVSIVNGDTLYLDKFAKQAPNIDVFSANVYRGDYGFGSFWDQVKDATDKPAFIKEYGAPAYGHQMTKEEANEAQAAYHRGNWYDILENSAGYKTGAGNSLGGVIFEWLDEWWKNYEPAMHDTKTDVIGPFPGGYYFEEWFGIIGQGNGKNSPFMRQPRASYYTYRDLWN